MQNNLCRQRIMSEMEKEIGCEKCGAENKSRALGQVWGQGPGQEGARVRHLQTPQNVPKPGDRANPIQTFPAFSLFPVQGAHSPCTPPPPLSAPPATLKASRTLALRGAWSSSLTVTCRGYFRHFAVNTRPETVCQALKDGRDRFPALRASPSGAEARRE